MRTRKFTFAAMLAFISVATLHAETVDEIINKHLDAIGGKDAWRKITCIRMEGTTTVQGSDIAMTFTRVQRKGARMDISVMGMSGYTILTPTDGWTYMPFQGQTKPEPMTADDVKAAQDELDLQGELVDYKDKGNTVELLGKEDVDGTECWKLKVTFKGGLIRTNFIDPATYYIIKHTDKMTVNGQEHEQSINFSNFKKLPEGIVVPMTIGSGMGDVVLKKVEINGKVDDSLFKAG